MSYAECRSEKVFLILAATILLYSITLSVIAQNTNKFNFMENTKLRLSLSQMNEGMVNTGQLKTFNKYNNLDNAGLRITSGNENSLLFSYQQTDFSNLISSKVPTFKLKAEETDDRSLNNYTNTIKAPVDEKKWDAMVEAKYKNGLIRSVASGIKHIRIRRYTKSGPLYLNVVEINPSINPNIRIQPALSGSRLAQKQKISNIVKENGALVGINASFFKPSTGVPLGAMIINKEIITGPIYNRVVLGIKGNEFKMAKLNIDGRVITENGDEITIDNINQPRMLASYVLIYSDKWGKAAPTSPKYGMQVAVNDGIVIKTSTKQLDIAKKGFVLVGPEKKLRVLRVGDRINFKFTTNPDWSDIDHAVSGGPYLIKNGNIYIDAKDQKFGPITGLNPRTAIGYTKDNRFIMITIDGRKSSSVGVSLYTLANIMKEFGCYNAMNFDGGSSTQMIVNKKVVNNPTTTGGNPVSNGLIVKISG